jgi:hypothetical protein
LKEYVVVQDKDSKAIKVFFDGEQEEEKKVRLSNTQKKTKRKTLVLCYLLTFYSNSLLQNLSLTLTKNLEKLGTSLGTDPMSMYLTSILTKCQNRPSLYKTRNLQGKEFPFLWLIFLEFFLEINDRRVGAYNREVDTIVSGLEKGDVKAQHRGPGGAPIKPPGGPRPAAGNQPKPATKPAAKQPPKQGAPGYAIYFRANNGFVRSVQDGIFDYLDEMLQKNVLADDKDADLLDEEF